MNSEMPPKTTIAPIAMMIPELPLKPLPLPAVVPVVMVGVDVVAGGVDTPGCGNPGASGFVPCAKAAGGSTSAAARTMARTVRKALKNAPPKDYASGCSIAGVLGASAYGCSSGTSSSW